MSKRHKRAPRHLINARGEMIERDNGEHECWLAVHGRTRGTKTTADPRSLPLDEARRDGAAYIVSLNGDREKAITVPAALIDLGAPCGAILSTNMRTQPPTLERAVVYWCSGPGFIFDEKGLRA